MPTESEFEAVVSEADVESGVVPMSGNMSAPTSAQKSSGPSGPSFISKWFNFAGMQKVTSPSFA